MIRSFPSPYDQGFSLGISAGCEKRDVRVTKGSGRAVKESVSEDGKLLTLPGFQKGTIPRNRVRKFRSKKCSSRLRRTCAISSVLLHGKSCGKQRIGGRAPDSPAWLEAEVGSPPVMHDITILPALRSFSNVTGTRIRRDCRPFFSQGPSSGRRFLFPCLSLTSP